MTLPVTVPARQIACRRSCFGALVGWFANANTVMHRLTQKVAQKPPLLSAFSATTSYHNFAILTSFFRKVMNEMEKYDYSKLLGRIRERGYTQDALAREIGLGPTSFNLTLNNKRGFRQDEIVRVANVLGILPAEYEHYFFAH